VRIIHGYSKASDEELFDIKPFATIHSKKGRTNYVPRDARIPKNQSQTIDISFPKLIRSSSRPRVD